MASVSWCSLIDVELCVALCICSTVVVFFFFQAEDGIRDLVRSRGLGDVYKRQLLILLLVQPVRQGGSRRFIDNAHDIEASDLAGVFGGLALAVIEVGLSLIHI